MVEESVEKRALNTLSNLLLQRDVDLTTYRDNPVGFVNDILKMQLWSKQQQTIESVKENRATVIEAAHGTGKSISAAMLTCWWLSIYEEAVVITLAPTWQQVSSIIWRYTRHMGRKSKLPGMIFDTPRWDIAPNRYAIGLSPRKATKEDMVTLQGYHSPNLLVIMDEAAGLPRTLFEGVVSLCVSENNHILAIGNPIEKSGPFYEACNSANWKHIRISALEHPNVIEGRDIIPGAVSRAWVEEMIRDHCSVYSDPYFTIEKTAAMSDEELQTLAPPETFVWNRVIYLPRPIFEAKVLGRPPDEGSDQLISLAWVEAAKKWEAPAVGEKVIGFDPARYGGDYATMIMRQGSRILWLRRRRPVTKNPSDEFAGWLKNEVMKAGPDTWCFIDEIGVGSGVLDAARRLQLNVRGVAFSRRARQTKRFSNMRAEAWFRIRERLQRGELSLPDDDLLTGDLTAPKYTYDDLGRYLLEDKDQIKKRIGRSPDSGDALALTFCSPSLDQDYSEEYDREELRSEQGSRWYLASRGNSSRWKLPNSGRRRLRR